MADDDFVMAGAHDIRVQVLLNADEYLFLRDISKERGLSNSSFFRQVLNFERRRKALESLSDDKDKNGTAEDTQDMHTLVTLLTKLMKSSN